MRAVGRGFLTLGLTTHPFWKRWGLAGGEWLLLKTFGGRDSGAGLTRGHRQGVEIEQNLSCWFLSWHQVLRE